MGVDLKATRRHAIDRRRFLSLRQDARSGSRSTRRRSNTRAALCGVQDLITAIRHNIHRFPKIHGQGRGRRVAPRRAREGQGTRPSNCCATRRPTRSAPNLEEVYGRAAARACRKGSRRRSNTRIGAADLVQRFPERSRRRASARRSYDARCRRRARTRARRTGYRQRSAALRLHHSRPGHGDRHSTAHATGHQPRRSAAPGEASKSLSDRLAKIKGAVDAGATSGAKRRYREIDAASDRASRKPAEQRALGRERPGESGGNPHKLGDNGAAIGKGHATRTGTLSRVAAGHDMRQATADEQLAFADYELREGGEKAAGDRLKAQTTPGGSRRSPCAITSGPPMRGRSIERAAIAQRLMTRRAARFIRSRARHRPRSSLTAKRVAGAYSSKRLDRMQLDIQMSNVQPGTEVTARDGNGRNIPVRVLGYLDRPRQRYRIRTLSNWTDRLFRASRGGSSLPDGGAKPLGRKTAAINTRSATRYGRGPGRGTRRLTVHRAFIAKTVTHDGGDVLPQKQHDQRGGNAGTGAAYPSDARRAGLRASNPEIDESTDNGRAFGLLRLCRRRFTDLPGAAGYRLRTKTNDGGAARRRRIKQRANLKAYCTPLNPANDPAGYRPRELPRHRRREHHGGFSRRSCASLGGRFRGSYWRSYCTAGRIQFGISNFAEAKSTPAATTVADLAAQAAAVARRRRQRHRGGDQRRDLGLTAASARPRGGDPGGCRRRSRRRSPDPGEALRLLKPQLAGFFRRRRCSYPRRRLRPAARGDHRCHRRRRCRRASSQPSLAGPGGAPARFRRIDAESARGMAGAGSSSRGGSTAADEGANTVHLVHAARYAVADDARPRRTRRIARNKRASPITSSLVLLFSVSAGSYSRLNPRRLRLSPKQTRSTPARRHPFAGDSHDLSAQRRAKRTMSQQFWRGALWSRG